jgi:hypothetical protein
MTSGVYIRTMEHRNQISKLKKLDWEDKIKRMNMSKKRSSIGRKNISDARKGKCSSFKGKHHSEKAKLKLRNATIKYLQIQKFNGLPLKPCIGKQEKPIIDFLEKECLGYPVIRQYFIGGYWLDGYCPTLNLAIEIDEFHCHKNKAKDLLRENFIKEQLNCKFLRIEV